MTPIVALNHTSFSAPGRDRGYSGAQNGPVANHWTGKLILLRGIEPADWESFHAFDQDTEGQRMGWKVPFPRGREATRKSAEERANESMEGQRSRMAIEVLESGALAGLIHVHDANIGNGTFEYGINLGPAFRGKGYGSEAIRLVLRHYFRELGYQKANATVYAFNEASQAMHRKFGFVEEGRIRSNHFSAGEFHDELWFGMTAEEFGARYGWD